VTKKEYNAKEAAVALLEKIKAKAQGHMAKSQKKEEEQPLEKAAPQNQTSAKVADIKVPSQETPKANEKAIPRSNKEPIKLKKFMEHIGGKRLAKAEKGSK
jgi:hypothetical protein